MTKQRKPHIKELSCFKQVAKVIGEANAQLELCKVVHCRESSFDDAINLLESFFWDDTPQGFDFWNDIDEGINPYGK